MEANNGILPRIHRRTPQDHSSGLKPTKAKRRFLKIVGKYLLDGGDYLNICRQVQSPEGSAGIRKKTEQQREESVERGAQLYRELIISRNAVKKAAIELLQTGEKPGNVWNRVMALTTEAEKRGFGVSFNVPQWIQFTRWMNEQNKQEQQKE